MDSGIRQAAVVMNRVIPPMAEMTVAARIATFAKTRWELSPKARSAMKSDMVNPMPPSQPARIYPRAMRQVAL